MAGFCYFGVTDMDNSTDETTRASRFFRLSVMIVYLWSDNGGKE